MSAITIDGKALGAGQKTFIVFEAGPTHDGFETACRLVDVAAEAGADAVKFQIVDVDKLVPDREQQFIYEYLADRETGRIETVSESLWEILKRRELNWDEWRELVAYCKAKGIAFFSTATNEAELEFLASFGLKTVKICSGDISFHHLLRKAAKYDWAVQIDTGGATLAEVEQAIEVLEENGCNSIVINHCPSGYPARLESINLRVIGTLLRMYPDYAVAFSDHTPGNIMDVAAVSLGAQMIEKTITLDRTIRSPEHIMSLEPSETKDFVKTIRELEIALGSPRRFMSAEEREKQEIARRSLYAARDMERGWQLGQEDIVYARPGNGITADQDILVLGRTLKVDVKGGRQFSFGDFE